jgi:hypothetical protein
VRYDKHTFAERRWNRSTEYKERVMPRTKITKNCRPSMTTIIKGRCVGLKEIAGNVEAHRKCIIDKCRALGVEHIHQVLNIEERDKIRDAVNAVHEACRALQLLINGVDTVSES